MKVVVTGAGGFLAGWTAAAFAKAGARVAGIDRGMADVGAHPAQPKYAETIEADVRDEKAYEAWIRAWEPEVVVHLAGPADVEASFDDPTGDLRGHLEPLLALYGCVLRLRLKPRVLVISSAAVYGQPSLLPTSEGAPLQPISPYGYHKSLQELLVEEFARLHGVPGCRARVFSVYGEGLRHLAFWDITRRALRGDGRIHGTGDETRDYLHASDVAAALVAVAQHSPFVGEAVNIASGVETRIVDLARGIHAECGLGSTEPVDRVAERGKPARWLANVEKLRATGFRQAVPLETGIKRTVEWIRGQD